MLSLIKVWNYFEGGMLMNFFQKSPVSIKEAYRSPMDQRVIPWFGIQGDQTLRLDYDLNENSIVFDLGGYQGKWSYDIYKKYGCYINVFEPVPEYASQIEKLFSGNNKVKIHCYGLGSQNQTQVIGIEQDGSSIFKSSVNSQEIVLKNATDFMQINHISHIDLMKINIEGGEYDLLEHLIDTGFISFISNIQVQFHDFVPNAIDRMQAIHDKLAITHETTYQYLFVWENWRKKVPQPLKEVLLVVDDAFLENRIFELESNLPKHESAKMPHFQLKQELFRLGYDFKTFDKGNIDSADKIIFMNIPFTDGLQYRCLKDCEKRGLGHKMMLWLWEGPSVMSQQWNRQLHSVFSKVFSWHDGLVDGEKYIKFHLPVHYWNDMDTIPFYQKKLCTMIAYNKNSNFPLELYSERVRAVEALQRLCPYQFDLYGVGWNQPTNQLQQQHPYLIPHYPSYCGSVTSKIEAYKKYKFSICYENLLDIPGYITEKIFHCFMAGCIPIYLGANNISHYVPENTFIDRRKFDSYEKLYAHLISMSGQEHNIYIENINKYLKSELFFKKFSDKAFTDTMVSHIVADSTIEVDS